MLKLHDTNTDMEIYAQMENGDAFRLPHTCQGLEEAIDYALTEWVEGQDSASIYDANSSRGFGCLYGDGTFVLEAHSMVWTASFER